MVLNPQRRNVDCLNPNTLISFIVSNSAHFLLTLSIAKERSNADPHLPCSPTSQLLMNFTLMGTAIIATAALAAPANAFSRVFSNLATALNSIQTQTARITAWKSLHG
jgi:hypothetical protein